jgi:hypothetical protein
METQPADVESIVARGAAAVLAAAGAVPDAGALAEELAFADAASDRGYFLPDEDALVRLRYGQYLVLRAALLETVGGLGAAAGTGAVEWEERLPVFVTAFAAACVLMRATGFVVDLAKDRPVVWKKLDEPDVRAGIPRKSFTALYKAAAGADNWRRFLAAADFYFAHREEIRALAADPVLRPLVALLEAEEPRVERRRRAALKRLFAYRWFSFLRRNRSAWRQVMFGFFRVSGSAIAGLRRPGVKLSGAPKRITAGLREEILAKAKPGDVFVTRHDDALSNLFLPGFWPHAALYLGTAENLAALGIEVPSGITGPGQLWFLESKKDGVRFRQVEETLAVDACVVLRSPLETADLATAIRRAMSHAGKPYDFLFDFRTADVLACTEVIYRGFHGTGAVRFHLAEVGGRLCLPAEELLEQALDSGFRVIGCAGLGGDRVLFGGKAGIAFHGSRQPL